jgi:hypothetical protein
MFIDATNEMTQSPIGAGYFVGNRCRSNGAMGIDWSDFYKHLAPTGLKLTAMGVKIFALD